MYIHTPFDLFFFKPFSFFSQLSALVNQYCVCRCYSPPHTATTLSLCTIYSETQRGQGKEL